MKSDGEHTTKDYFKSDEVFNSLFPDHINEVAARHWTPMEVAIKSSAFLATHPGARVLDIGSGSGKFCFIAAHLHPLVQFNGIEQREDLVDLCNELKRKLNIENVEFFHGNISEADLEGYDHFYFYNSFYENLPGTQKIDHNVFYSEKLYDYYNLYLYKQLMKRPSGTRLVTYHSLGNEVPPGYEVVSTDHAEFLKFWVKI